MKTYILKIAVIVSLTIMITACEKDKDSADNLSNQAAAELKMEPMSYWVDYSNLEEELTTITDPAFNSEYLKQYPNAELKIIADKINNRFNFILFNSGKVFSKVIISQAIVCEGSGASFVYCVKNWLDANPHGCLVITKVDGTYYANDEGCD